MFAFDFISTTLTNLDFLPIQRFTAPTGTIWHAFAAGDEESWWHEEPIVWEVFVAELGVDSSCRELPGSTADSPSSQPSNPGFYVHGTLLSPGTFIHTEREWAAALVRLLPEGESWTRMEDVD